MRKIWLAAFAILPLLASYDTKAQMSRSDDVYIVFLYDVSRSYADLGAATGNVDEMKKIVAGVSKPVTIGFSSISDCQCRDDDEDIPAAAPCRKGWVEIKRREMNWGRYRPNQGGVNSDGTFARIHEQLRSVEKTDLYGAIRFASRRFMSNIDRWRYLIVFSDLDEDLPKWCPETALEPDSLNDVTVYVINFREVPRYKVQHRKSAMRRKTEFERALFGAGAVQVKFENDIRQIIQEMNSAREQRF